MKMKIKKIIKKIKKFCKKLKRRFSGSDKEKCNEKSNEINNEKYNEKNNENCQDATMRAQAVQPLPFISVFASMKIQKEQKSAFLMVGNDISKINSDAYTPLYPHPKNAAIDASVKIEMKDQDSDSF